MRANALIRSILLAFRHFESCFKSKLFENGPIKMDKPSGIIPALRYLTDARGKFDEESERSLVKRSIEWGVSGVAVSIIAGEFYKFTDNERKHTFEYRR